MTFYKCIASFALLTLCFALTAQAQKVRVTLDQERPKVWRTFIGPQLAQSLDSPVAQIRDKALEQVIMLARFYGELDLSATVPALLAIYTEDSDEQRRLAAVVGLHALGDEGGLQQMRLGLARQPSHRVQHLAIAALMDHYGPETFHGAEDVAALVEQVRARSEADKEFPLLIARENQ